MHEIPISYRNVNDGDVFQDIHPWEKMFDTQSQKALYDIYFHKDLANHFARPDWVNIISLRHCPENIVSTSFVRNADIIENLSDSEKKVLAENRFYTPFDDLSVTGSLELGDADKHAILNFNSDSVDVRFFENRTLGLDPEAQKTIYSLTKVLHRFKQRFQLNSGTFLGSSNNDCLHCKENIYLPKKDLMQCRWLQKTVNVSFIERVADYLEKDSNYIIEG